MTILCKYISLSLSIHLVYLYYGKDRCSLGQYINILCWCHQLNLMYIWICLFLAMSCWAAEPNRTRHVCVSCDDPPQLEESSLVHFQSNALLKKAKTHRQMYKKQSTNFIILSLQRHEPLYPQNISLGKNKTKNSFSVAVHQQAQRKRFQSNGTRDTDNIETKTELNIVGK